MIQEQNLSDYERGTRLRHGGQASVYKYNYPQTNEVFAVKILKLVRTSVDDRQITAEEKKWIPQEVVVTSGTNHVRPLLMTPTSLRH